MKNFFKYGVFPIVIVLFLVVVTVMLMPALINVQKYVPEIEKSISKAAGRPFTIGPDVAVSFFPWLSLTFSDLKLGNPPGFVSEGLVRIDSFEARIKLLPLLKKEIQISRFVVGGLEINLERNSEGKVNWELLRSAKVPRLDLLQDSVFCTLLAVTDGSLHWIDRTSYVRHKVEDLMILLNNVQADRPITFDFQASFDGRPISLEGSLGPLRQQRSEALPVDLAFRLLETVQGRVQGKVENWRSAPVYDVAFNLASFSPRALFTALERAFPFAADPDAFQTAELSVSVKGGMDNLSVEKGAARLDDTMVAFTGEVKSLMNRPEIRLALDVDQLEPGRYFGSELPAQTGAGQAEGGKGGGKIIPFLAKEVALGGTVKVGTLKAAGWTAVDIEANLEGKDGIIRFDPATMKLFGGQLQADLVADLSTDLPKMQISAQSQGLDAAALLREAIGRDILNGNLSAEVELESSGYSPAAMLENLSGKAIFSCLDGTVPGVDLQRSLERRELVDASTGSDRGRMRTDFSELRGGVAIDKGRLLIREATLASPAMAIAVGGGADLSAGEWTLQLSPQDMQAKTGKGKGSQPLTLAGTFAGAASGQPAAVGDGRQANVAILVDEKIPSPVDEDVKDLVGKPLIDPAIVAQRFHLQRETIRRSEMKKQLQLGSGKIRINPLMEESSL